MFLSAVSRFCTLKFHPTNLPGAVARGFCSVNFGLKKSFHNDPCCVGSPRNTASLLTSTLEGENYITYSIELLHFSHRAF
jgi:hypothetical protein